MNWRWLLSCHTPLLFVIIAGSSYFIAKPFLKSGAFHLQQIQPISLPKLERKLGTLTDKELEGLGRKIVQLLKLSATA